ncbi:MULTISPECIES: phosphatase PAP2 family protein [unclassified Shewanella]|uniref:phosphatase PAP2 family protein n=1 Tax=Shewanella TaxID=22 RepID=UPI001568D44C|nr:MULTISPECIES: phosphatase PAP2 family protein [unclassified Shewanella]MCU8021342.1 phosphatase PAP2 family protein [Shewanella sp. SM78]MCU8043358.1 phosphatase PAP2 family protein [Shewanella sp. SM68]MCU8048620.1 phosphatase PAP2 family protein [Shewanella sp. SM65]MCU8078628.1 phosphatase PAP2 family protein [Shewanella sp. SM103]
MLSYVADLDKRMFCHIVSFTQHYGLYARAKRVSASGDGHVYLYLSVGLMLTHAQGQALFNLMLASFLVELPLYLLLKNSIRRTRPCHALVGFESGFEPSDRFSLPSGHTAAAFVMATSVAQIYPAAAPVAYLWAFSIGGSRIALGVHYPLDILAGASLGIGSVLLVHPVI